MLFIDLYREKHETIFLSETTRPRALIFGMKHYLVVFYTNCDKMAARAKWASSRENLSSGVCEQHRGRPACTSGQSDQRLCYSLFGKYHI